LLGDVDVMVGQVFIGLGGGEIGIWQHN
jgi:hypothetical protein